MPNILHVPLYAYHSSYNHTQPKQIVQEQTGIQKQYGLAQHLAQARCARSGEPPPRLGESTKKQGHEQHGISLKRDPSRLGELPARSKVERVAWATFRAKNLGELHVSSRLGEMDSLGRD